MSGSADSKDKVDLAFEDALRGDFKGRKVVAKDRNWATIVSKTDFIMGYRT